MLSDEQLEKTREFIFRHGRLIERQLYEYFFRSGTVGACMAALRAYQNADGGFGNGIEPDLLCPGSSAIGAETAMGVLDLYLKYCGEGSQDRERMSEAVARLPALLEEHGDHFPLFGRYWYHAADQFDRDVLRRKARVFLDAFQEDGAIATAYPDLPWWRPIMTLDGLMVMKRLSLA
jgi:hypothetical protein